MDLTHRHYERIQALQKLTFVKYRDELEEYSIANIGKLSAHEDLVEDRLIQTQPEEPSLKRLEDYKLLNTDDKTVVNFFDERECSVHPVDVLVDWKARVKECLGKPRNSGPSLENVLECIGVFLW
jgi:hypothetical protein